MRFVARLSSTLVAPVVNSRRVSDVNLRRFLVVLLGLLSSGSALTVVTTSSTASAASCKAGLIKIDGVPARTFCGKAKMTLTVGGKAQAVPEGQCLSTGGLLTVNLGTIMLGPQSTKTSYVGVIIPATKDGTFTSNVTFAGSFGLSDLLVTKAKAVVSGNLTKGTITGTSISGLKGPVVASFTC